jgi:hypothetical protein
LNTEFFSQRFVFEQKTVEMLINSTRFFYFSDIICPYVPSDTIKMNKIEMIDEIKPKTVFPFLKLYINTNTIGMIEKPI